MTRQSPRGPAEVSEALKAAGRDLFSLRGVDQVGVRELTELAGVNQALVSRYFGSKTGLVQAVISDDAAVLADIAGASDSAADAALQMFDHMQKNPALARILASSILGSLEPDDVVAPTRPLEALRDRFEQDGYVASDAARAAVGTALVTLGWALFSDFLGAVIDDEIDGATIARDLVATICQENAAGH